MRLFAPITSNVTNVEFFVPGGGDIPAVTTGFGAIFTDVDEPDGRPRRHDKAEASTYLRFYDAYGQLLYTSVVPPSPGDASLSFFGVVFDDARIARIKIVSGDIEPRPVRREAQRCRRHGRLHLRRAKAGEVEANRVVYSGPRASSTVRRDS